MDNNKIKFIRLLLAHAEDVSETPEKAREYLRSQGIDPDKVVAEGVKKIQQLMKHIGKVKMKSSMIDHTGQRFGRLVVQELVRGRPKKPGFAGPALWKCLCDCGKETTVRGSELRSGNTQSCGCLHSEIMSERKWVLRKDITGQ